MKRKKRTILHNLTFVCRLIVLIVPLIFGGAVQAQDKPRSPIMLQYKADPDTERPLLTLTLAPNVTATFMVDTGSNFSVISTTLAKRLNLQAHPAVNSETKQSFLILGKPAEAVIVPNVSLGFLKFDVPLVLFPTERLRQADPANIDGFLGSDFWRQMAVYFDFDHHRITLWPGGSLTPSDVAQLGFVGPTAQPIPQVEQDNGLFCIAMRFNNKADAPVLIDTGAKNASISSAMANNLGLKPIRESISGEILQGNQVFDSYHVDAMKMGELTVVDTDVLCPRNPPDYFFPLHLGMNVLNRSLLLLDYPAHKLYARPGAPVGLGLDIFITLDLHMQVQGVDRGSPAEEAGIHKGDEICEVNGIPVQKDTLDRVAQQMSHRQIGDIIHFKIKPSGNTALREYKVVMRKLF